MGSGGSAAGYPVFAGMPYQRGAGVASMFRSFMRYLLPIGKQAGIAIGRQGLASGSRVLTDVLDGKDVKESLVSEGRAGLKNLLDKASDNLGRQKGQGGGTFDFKRYKRAIQPSAEVKPIKKKRPTERSLHSTFGPPTPRRGSRQKKKEIRTDALGSY